MFELQTIRDMYDAEVDAHVVTWVDMQLVRVIEGLADEIAALKAQVDELKADGDAGDGLMRDFDMMALRERARRV